MAKYVTGTAQPKMNQEKMNSIPVALPPLAVQNAIVAKLEQVLPLVDAYENAVLQKEELKNALPDKVKKSHSAGSNYRPINRKLAKICNHKRKWKTTFRPHYRRTQRKSPC